MEPEARNHTNLVTFGLFIGMTAAVVVLLWPAIMQISADATARSQAAAAAAQARADAAQTVERERTQRAQIDATARTYAAELRAEQYAAALPVTSAIALGACGLAGSIIGVIALDWTHRRRTEREIALLREEARLRLAEQAALQQLATPTHVITVSAPSRLTAHHTN